ncbi:aromatic/alkene monooxygenase hydroxylase subunit beta [Ralstonia pickettii]|jgi:phenol hydroxylase P1 protein|uniref:Phenol 2-monooxygenase n=3 Tax=Ralstonia TaxID=48736 RepID=C6BL56_RALP1|nr:MULTISPECIES: aromatic/alkene monooxygenase hydroxylase subunit beta [Ralstonia]MBA9883179.1 phenol hydroxylase [Ralstonia pickettii]MBA9892955.1 phenol hydroxylase [Ralstonia pickettii]MBA9925030.1 phenol hydroxylase [Ralstonia pickettii]MBB0093533.1 phenol hydroxylase [Ralstonia pickettii]MBB0102756.1 phenol hydroxylase [Ralstonia pickettii]
MNIDLQAREITPLRQTFAHVARLIGEGKAATRYQEATYGAQSMANFHYRPTWDPAHELYDAGRSRIRLADWQALKDPRQFYYATWTMTRARQQEAVEANFQFVESRGLASAMGDALRDRALQVLLPLRHVAWGANMNNASICAYGYGTAFTAPAMFHAMDDLGIAQLITRLALTLDEPAVLEAGKLAWLEDPRWQGLRRYVEDSFVVQDPVELFVAQNLALDGLLYPLIYGHFVDDHLALQGGTAVAILTSFMPEWHDETARWIDAVIKTMANAAEPEAAGNRALLSQWFSQWADRAQAALAPVAEMALGEHGAAALGEVRAALDARATKLGLSL